MQVLVLTAIGEIKEDLRIVMVARSFSDTQTVTMASPVIRLKGAAASRNGNPYLVYGDAVASFTGRSKYDTVINVFGCTSGDLERWQ